MKKINFLNCGICGDVNEIFSCGLEKNGKKVANAEIISIWTSKGIYNVFFSYDSMIMILHNGKIHRIGKNWDFSSTTSKHRNIFQSMSKKDIEKYIIENMTYNSNIEQYVLKGDN